MNRSKDDVLYKLNVDKQKINLPIEKFIFFITKYDMHTIDAISTTLLNIPLINDELSLKIIASE